MLASVFLHPAAPRRTRDGGKQERKRQVHQVGIPGGTRSFENTMLRILGSFLVGGLCWILYLKKNMRWDSLETSFFELVSILSFLNKKKGFSLFWIQIRETLVLSFSYNGSRKSLSQRSDWEGPFPSL